MNLWRLGAYGRGISDLAGLEAATNLQWLFAGSNALYDLRPLAGLDRLRGLDLSDNLISDLSPLAANAGLGAGDWVNLGGNPLTEESLNTHVPALLDKDVEVVLESITLTVASGREATFDLAGYFAALLGSGVDVMAESNDPGMASVEILDEMLNVTPGSDEGTVSVAVTATNADGENATLAVELTVAHAEPVAMFPSASDMVREGFVRVINHSKEAGIVRLEAVDDAGSRKGSVILALGENAAVHFNSGDLENGNRRKRLTGSTGAGQGDWYLELVSGLDVEVLSYIRTTDGFLTAMHDVVRESGGKHLVAIFNPGSNMDQVSRLRLTNPGDAAAEVTISGIDDAGASPGTSIEVEIPAGESLTLSASDLETGAGVDGALGDGTGKWRLEMTSDEPIMAMSLLSSPTGHLTNLSTVPKTPDDENGVHEVPLFPSASDPLERQGFARVVNRSADAGKVDIEAYDDSDFAYESVTLSIGARGDRAFQLERLGTGK